MSYKCITHSNNYSRLRIRVTGLLQISDSRSWDSTIEILGILEIKTSVDGLLQEIASNRLSLAVGATVKLNSAPRSSWVAYEEGAFDLRPNGQLIALKPGHGVAIARHSDERNSIHRESVSIPNTILTCLSVRLCRTQ